MLENLEMLMNWEAIEVSKEWDLFQNLEEGEESMFETDPEHTLGEEP